MLGVTPEVKRGKVMMTYAATQDRYMITSAYDQELVEIIKLIDHQCREYDANTKRWFVDTWAVEFLTTHMEAEGFRVHVEGGAFGTDVDATHRYIGIDILSNWISAMPECEADTHQWKDFARKGCNLGLRLLLLVPEVDGKPVDMRSPVQRRREDGQAQDVARMAGEENWERARSKSGIHLATDDDKLITRYIERYRSVYRRHDEDQNCPIYLAIAT